MSASQREKFSGWIILIACAISSGFQQALSNTGSLFATYIAADLGVTVGTVLLKNTVMNLVGMLSNMFLAKYIYAKIGTKKSFIVGSLLSVLVYLMYANVSSFAMFMVAAFINGFVVCIGMQTFTTACIAKWFYTGRKTTSSVMMAAIPGAAAVCSLLVGQLLAHFEWRTVYQIMAAIVFVTGCGSSLFVKDSPEQAGQKMLGYDKFLADQKKTGLQTKEEPSIDAADAQKTKFYWILVATVCCFALLSTTLGVYAPVFWQGQGMDVVQSSQLSSIISLLTLVYVIAHGALCDRFPVLKVAPILYSLGLIGIVGIVLLGGQGAFGAIVACAVLATLTRGVNLSFYTVVLPQAFGPKYMGKISGVFLSCFGLTGVLNPLLFGQLVDLTGSYEVSWFFEIGLGVVGVVMCFVLAKMLPSVQKRTIEIYTQKELANK